MRKNRLAYLCRRFFLCTFLYNDDQRVIELPPDDIPQAETKQRNEEQDLTEGDFPFMYRNINFYLFHKAMLARYA
jgi:hypothetical protein